MGTDTRTSVVGSSALHCRCALLDIHDWAPWEVALGPVAIARDEWEIALVVCTDRQLDVLDLYRRGHGYGSIGRILYIHKDTARGHVESAIARIQKFKKENVI